MRISPIALLLSALLGCGSGTQPAKPSAESGDNQAQQQKVATPEKQAASPAAKTPDAAAVKKHMTPDQLALGDPIVNSVGMVLVPIPAGEFLMGSPASESRRDEDETQHLVKIAKPFYLSVYEVTQQQYEKVMGTNPRAFSATGDGRNLKWADCRFPQAISLLLRRRREPGNRTSSFGRPSYRCSSQQKQTVNLPDWFTVLSRYTTSLITPFELPSLPRVLVRAAARGLRPADR